MEEQRVILPGGSADLLARLISELQLRQARAETHAAQSAAPLMAICDALQAALEKGAPPTGSPRRIRRREALHRLLFLAGISPRLKGGRYLRAALEMAADDPRLLSNLDGRLYPCLAEQFGDTPANVERSMRYAIAQLWQRMEADERLRLLPRCAAPPGNKAFLAALSERLEEAVLDEAALFGVEDACGAWETRTTAALISSR